MHRKKIMAILAAALGIALTACQPTPQAPIVQGKGGGQLEQKIEENTQSTPALTGEGLDFGAPERLSDEFQNESGKLTVHVDAPVIVPQTDALPIVRVAPRPIEQAEADAIISYFFGDRPLIGERDKSKGATKDELIRAIAASREKAAKMEEGKDKEEALARIARMEEELKTAPETIEEKAVVTTFQSQGNDKDSAIFVSCDLGQHDLATLAITKNGDRSWAEYNNGAGRDYVNVMDPEGWAVGPKVSLADAQKTADAAVQAIYPDGSVTLSAYGIGWYDDRDITMDDETAADIDHAPKSYVFEYLRVISSVPATYTTQDCNNLLSMDDYFTNPLDYERVEVQVDETGVASLRWNSPMQLGETMSPNAQLLSFDQVQEVFRKMIKIKYAFVDQPNEAYTVKSADAYVTRVALGYSRVASKDNPGEFMMVPVWDFFGYLVQDIPEIPEGGGVDDARMAYSDSLLTINALDGSVIDRGFGY